MFSSDLLLGMNDVLPKPFTKEGLMSLLNKYLGHLKKGQPALEVPSGPASLANQSGRQSVKDEDSPGKSPAVSLHNSWHSPANMSVVSPVASTMSESYMNSGGYGMDGGMPQYSSGPQTPLSARPAQQNHRRQISEISGGAEYSSDPKRQQVYGQHMPMHGR